MKWLFIDHECHKRTLSAKFFLDVVRKKNHIDEHYYKRHYKTGIKKIAADYDGAIIWEFPISRNKFFFRNQRNVFVPMYDNEWASFWQWKRISWSGIGVISFCDKVTKHARLCGVTNILDIRYFPNPADFPQRKGEAKRIFLWERGDISHKIVDKLFPPELGYIVDIKKDNEFLSKGEYHNRIASSEIIMAPRRKEGIGMAFLEAIAMGKCVVAHNDATMNEYITDGVNGILVDTNNPTPINYERIKSAILNIPQSSEKLYHQWLNSAERIYDFLLSQKKCNPSLINRIKIFLSYPLYLCEGICHTAKEILNKGT